MAKCENVLEIYRKVSENLPENHFAKFAKNNLAEVFCQNSKFPENSQRIFQNFVNKYFAQVFCQTGNFLKTKRVFQKVVFP